MSDSNDQSISLKIIYDPHNTDSVINSKECECNNDENCVILTRYLYNKTEVEISLTKSIFDQQLDNALFWGYELYYSGFMEDIFNIIFSIYTTYYRDNHPLFEEYIIRMTKKWQESIDSYEIIGSLITNLLYCKMSLYSEIKKRQNIKTNDINNNSVVSQKYIMVNPTKFEIYKTIEIDSHPSIIDNPWKSMDILCRYEPVRNIADILGKKIHKNQYPLKHGWEYYAYKSPIWKKRIDKYGGIVNEDIKTIEFIDENAEEEFYDRYGYDLDEQPIHIQNMTMCLDNIQPQLSWDDFCNMYNNNNNNIHINTFKIKIKKNVNI